MDLTHYTFAFFVFILVCGVILLLGRVLGSGKKSEKGNYEKEQRLFKLYQNVEDMMTSFEEYVEESQAKIDESYKKVIQLIENSHKTERKTEPVQDVSNEVKSPDETVKDIFDIPFDISSDSTSDMPSDMPAEEAIPYLLKQGLAKEEIAKQLGISNREVTLIMGIKKMKKETD